MTDVDKFACATLAELGHALAGRNWLAGNWSIRTLIERLEQVGVVVELTASLPVVSEPDRSKVE